MDNKRHKVSLEFDAGDLPMIRHALSIGRATALLCGHPEAQKKFDAYCKTLEAMIPKAALLFEAEVWSTIVDRLLVSKTWSVTADQTNEFHKFSEFDFKTRLQKGPLFVVVDGVKFRTNKIDILQNGVAEQAIKDLISDIAPMTTIYVDYVPPPKVDNSSRPAVGR